MHLVILCCNIIIGNLFNRMGTLGLTGQQATVEDHIYIVRVYLTKAGNLKVCRSFLSLTIRIRMFTNGALKGGAEVEAG